MRAKLGKPNGIRESLGLVEGFRGDIRADGAIERCHLRDPSWFQWPLLIYLWRSAATRSLPSNSLTTGRYREVVDLRPASAAES